MKVNFDKVLVDFISGKDMFMPLEAEVRDADGNITKPAVTKPFTLKEAAISALMMVDPQKITTTPGTEKMRRFALGLKLHNGKYDISAEDVTLLKMLIGEGYNPMIVGQAWDLLEGGK